MENRRRGWASENHQHVSNKKIVGRKGRYSNRRYADFTKSNSSATNETSDDLSHESKTSAVKSDFEAELSNFSHIHQVIQSNSNDSSVGNAMANVGTLLASNLSNIIAGAGGSTSSCTDQTDNYRSPNSDVAKIDLLSQSLNENEAESSFAPDSPSEMTGNVQNKHIESSSRASEKGKDTIIQMQQRTGFVRALIDSTVPNDIMDNTVGLARGDFRVEKRTLLHHAATSDEYDLFSKNRKRMSAAAKTRNIISTNKSSGDC